MLNVPVVHTDQERIRDLLCQLPLEDREVLYLRFGFDRGKVQRTLKELSECFIWTQDEVRKRELRGLITLKGLLRGDSPSKEISS